MTTSNNRYLLFLTKNYSYSVLKPLYDEIIGQCHGEVYWFSTKNEHFDIGNGQWLNNANDVVDFCPDAVFAPGNVVPYKWPGLKVQLFHGLGEEKQGHYRINGLFDMYCTPGPYVTNKFNKKNGSRQYVIMETGWPKIDTIYKILQISVRSFKNDYPTILYAPTFSPKLTSAFELYDKIKSLRDKNYNWIIKFHELMDKSVRREFQALKSPDCIISDSNDILDLMAKSDLLLTDTSSVAYEYLFFNKPIVTYKAKTRIDKGINIINAADLEGAIIRALGDPDEYRENRDYYISELHPYRDGNSSRRVLQAVQKVIESGYIPPKSYNLTRQLNRWKIRNLLYN